MNHKRMQREVKKQLKQVGIETKSQQVLKLQQEENKMARISRSREQKEEEQKRQFAICLFNVPSRLIKNKLINRVNIQISKIRKPGEEDISADSLALPIAIK